MPYRRVQADRGSDGQLVGFLVGCFTGVVIGATLGVLMAPHRGDITRRKLARRAEETKEQVVDKVGDLMVHRSDDEDADVDEEANS